MLIVSKTISSSSKVEFFIYQDGNYVHDTERKATISSGPSYMVVKLFCNNYFVSNEEYLIYVKNWERISSRRYVERNLIYGDKLIAFAGNDRIYVIRANHNHLMVISKFDTISGQLSTYFINENANDYTFGFEKGNVIYLYNKVSKSFISFVIYQ